MMRIAMVSEHASPLAALGGTDAGGQNVYVAQVARHLSESGHSVDVFTRQDATSQPRVAVAQPGLRVVHVPAGPPSFVPKERLLRFMPGFARFCDAWLRSAAPYDVVHANFFMSGWVGLRLRGLLGVPLVTTFHALGLVRRLHQRDADAFPRARIAIERALAARSDRIVAECPQDRLDLETLYAAPPERIETVPCGFDPREFSPLDRDYARSVLGIPQDEFMILQLGRMVPRKGIETVVRAIAERPCRGMRLRIVGGDCEEPDPVRTPEIGRLQGIARACGIADQVIFAGRRRRTELRLWYAASDVFVTTPWYEPFGITPLEAMACARPVVGSQVGGVQFSVQDGVTGLLVPSRDPPKLAAALAALRADPARATAMGRAGLARARAEFTWERVARDLARVFAEVKQRDAATPVRRREVTKLVPPLLHIADGSLPAVARRRARIAPSRPAIFLDKDGTLIRDVPFNVDPAHVRFMPGALPALRRWRAAGYRLVVVTNQPGLGLGLFDRDALVRLHVALSERLAADGAPLDGFYACPHVENAGCACRKPRPGLLLRAAYDLHVDLEGSWIVGDILNDVEAGHRAGCRAVLVDVGNETDWRPGALRVPEYSCRSLADAAEATLRAPPARSGAPAPAVVNGG